MCPVCRARWLASDRARSLALFTMLSPISTALALSAACIATTSLCWVVMGCNCVKSQRKRLNTTAPPALSIDALSAINGRLLPCIVMCAGH
jgi:hypothetical protein